jgi:hypothetical protein
MGYRQCREISNKKRRPNGDLSYCLSSVRLRFLSLGSVVHFNTKIFGQLVNLSAWIFIIVVFIIYYLVFILVRFPYTNSVSLSSVQHRMSQRRDLATWWLLRDAAYTYSTNRIVWLTLIGLALTMWRSLLQRNSHLPTCLNFVVTLSLRYNGNNCNSFPQFLFVECYTYVM